MNLIDYSANITKCTESYDDIKKRIYNEVKENLSLHIGDTVIINIPKENQNQKQFNNLINKEFKIIDVELSFIEKNNLLFKLNTSEKINLFSSKYLEKIN